MSKTCWECRIFYLFSIHDRDSKRRKISRSGHDSYSPQGLPPHSYQSPLPNSMHVNGPHNYGGPQGNPPYGSMNMYPNSVQSYNTGRFGPPIIQSQPPPRFDFPNGPSIMNRSGPPQSHAPIIPRHQTRIQPPINSYSGSTQPPHSQPIQQQSSSHSSQPIQQSIPPQQSQPLSSQVSIRDGFSISSHTSHQHHVLNGTDYSYIQQSAHQTSHSSIHQPLDHGRHATTPLSPTSGAKRKPSIFHTPVHKPAMTHGNESSSTPKSPSETKRVPLQARRDVQLHRISTNLPDHDERKLTKEELLNSIENYDVEIAKLEKELSNSKQSKISDSVIVDKDKYLQDIEIIKKPQMHQLIFSNFVKSVEAHSKFDNIKYIPNSIEDSEVPLQDEEIWKSIYAKCREDHKQIEVEMTKYIKQNMDRDKKWLRTIKKNFFDAQKKWLKVNKIKIKPPSKDWLALAAKPTPMLTEQDREFVFLNDNLFVEDPVLEEADYFNKSAELSRWSEYEIEIFRQKYHLFPKNFRKISEFLPNKSVGDCICFYYHNKKDPILKQVMEEVKAKGSFQAAWAEGSTIGNGKSNHAQSESGNDFSSKHGSDDDLEDSGDEQYIFKPSSRGRPKRKKGKENGDEWTEYERAQFIEVFENFPKDWKRIANAIQSKSVAQCKNFFLQYKDDLGIEKGRRRGRRSTRSSAKAEETKKAAQQVANNKPSRTSTKRKNVNKRQVNYWTKTEKIDFLQCLQKYGKDWKTIAENLESKTESQVMKYYHSIKKGLGLSTSDEDSEEKLERKKKEQQERKDEDYQTVDSKILPDNDLRFFAEIAVIKQSIDLNSEYWIDDLKEEKTYSNTTLLQAWIAKKYLSGIPPTDERPIALEVLAKESVKKYKYQSIPDDIKPFITEDYSEISNLTELNSNDGLGYFWGDHLLSETEDDYIPPIGVVQHVAVPISYSLTVDE